MDLNEYQTGALTTAIFTKIDPHPISLKILRIFGELGKASEKIKKTFRDKAGKFEETEIPVIQEFLDDAELSTVTLNLDFLELVKEKPEEYQGENVIYPILGLCGEVGETAEKTINLLKSGASKQELAIELSDVLWYLAVAANTLGYTLEEIGQMNLDKLKNRKERGVISGSGDNR